jgi:hypothetical protein
MRRVTARSDCRRAATAVALVALLLALPALLGGCAKDERAAPTDPWPLTLDEPGLLAYAAVTLPESVRDDALAKLSGWHPRGLSAGRPLVVVHLDAKTYGGPVALFAPVADADAFHASLRECAALHDLGDGHYRLDPPRNSGLQMLTLLITGAMQGASPLAMLGSMADTPASFGFELSEEDGQAIFAPSFEAAVACRSVLRSLDGFASAPPHTVVLSLDLARLRTVYAEPLAKAESQLRGVLSGAGTAGALGAAMMMKRGHGAGGPELPVNWELLWALKDMFALGHVEAAQLAADFPPEVWKLMAGEPEAEDSPDNATPDAASRRGHEDEGDEPAGDDEARRDARGTADIEKFFELLGGPVTARVRLTPASSVAGVLAAAAPTPEIADARFVFAADPKTFAPAVAAWCAPIAEVVKGRGPPAQRYADEFARLLGAWDGLLAVVPAQDGRAMLLAGLAPGRAIEADAWRAWLEPLLATAHIEGFGGSLVDEVQTDGRHVLRDAGGAIALSYGAADDVVWAVAGEQSAPTAAALSAFREARASRAALAAGKTPVLRLDAPFGSRDGGAGTRSLHAAIRVNGDEVQLSWQYAARDR